MKSERTFSLSDVLSKGFEACCIAPDGAHYVWRRSFGVRIDRRTGQATVLTDPTVLPDATWVATSLGARQLEAAAPKRAKRKPGETA